MTESIIILQVIEIFSKYSMKRGCSLRDNCPQFSSQLKNFVYEYVFRHFKITKNVVKKNQTDMSLALLSYDNTTLERGISLEELLYNRKLRSPLPMLTSVLNDNVETGSLKEKECMLKEIQKICLTEDPN